MKVYTSHSLEETRAIAKEWLSHVSQMNSAAGVATGAVVVGLSGHLGAGKTAFVKLVAEELGVTVDVTSPTFVIMKIYEIQHGQFQRLVHIDAYRLEKPQELAALDFDRIAADPHNLVMVEWPENVGLDKTKARIEFRARGEDYEVKID